MESSGSSMVYRYLGNSGIKVSVLSYGTWLTAHKEESEEAIIACMKRAFELGVNFFDTAEIYGSGVAEEIMGRGIKEIGCERDQIVVATKLGKLFSIILTFV